MFQVLLYFHDIDTSERLVFNRRGFDDLIHKVMFHMYFSKSMSSVHQCDFGGFVGSRPQTGTFIDRSIKRRLLKRKSKQAKVMSEEFVSSLFAYFDHRRRGHVRLHEFLARLSVSDLVHSRVRHHSYTMRHLRQLQDHYENLAMTHFGFVDALRFHQPLVSFLGEIEMEANWLCTKTNPIGNLIAKAQVQPLFVSALGAMGLLDCQEVEGENPVVPIVLACSLGVGSTIKNTITPRDMLMMDNNSKSQSCFVAQLHHDELVQYLCSLLNLNFSRDTMFTRAPFTRDFPSLDTIGIVYNIDEPDLSFLFDQRLNESNTLEGAYRVRIKVKDSPMFLVVTDEAGKKGGTHFSTMIKSQRWTELLFQGGGDDMTRHFQPLLASVNGMLDDTASCRTVNTLSFLMGLSTADNDNDNANTSKGLNFSEFNRISVFFVDRNGDVPKGTVLENTYDDTFFAGEKDFQGMVTKREKLAVLSDVAQSVKGKGKGKEKEGE